MGTRSQLPSNWEIFRPPLTLPGHGFFNQAGYKPFSSHQEFDAVSGSQTPVGTGMSIHLPAFRSKVSRQGFL